MTETNTGNGGSSPANETAGVNSDNHPPLKSPKTEGGSPKKKKPGRKKKEVTPVYQKTENFKPLEKKDKAPVSITLTLSRKQGDAMMSTEKFVLYGGAKGGGKSWFLCQWLFHNACRYKGNKLFACRKRSVDFTNTTLETWKKAIPAHLYRINEQKKKIYIDRVKSVIDYGGLDDPMLVQSLNSAEYAQVGIDQAEEVDQDSFSMIRGTLRHRLPNGEFPPYQVMLTANPAQCWLKDEFILKSQPDFKFIPALPTDNPYLPPDYVNNLAEAFKHRPQLLAAYLHGSWDDLSSSDICIQGSWVEKAKEKEPYGKPIKRIIVNDPARFGDDENVIYVMEETSNCAYVIDEIFLEHKSLMDTAGRLVALRKKYDASLIAVDAIGIGAGIVDSLNEMREPVLSLNSSSKPTSQTKEKKYLNLRAQMWMEAGEKFAEGSVAIPKDSVLSGQLSSVKFDFKSNGRIFAEGKEDLKKRLGRSPDRADAFIMGLYALSQAKRLDQYEVDNAESDSQGHGHKVEEEDKYSMIGDFSGYGWAE